MTATFYVGDAVKVMNTLPEKSVDLILTSPPFLALRSYLPQDHPDKSLEGGSQATPGAYIDWLLEVVEACARVLAPHGSLIFELGDTYSGSGGAGGDYQAGGWRDGQEPFDGSALRDRSGGSDDSLERRDDNSTVVGSGQRDAANFKYQRVAREDGLHPYPVLPNNTVATKGTGWPLAKSLSLIPESFRWAMVYGINPHTGRTTQPWRLRNVIRWVRPNPPVGALGDKFRPATSELMVFCKAKDRFFDLDAVRSDVPTSSVPAFGDPKRQAEREAGVGGNGWLMDRTYHKDGGAPPLDWWNIPPGGYPGAHYAVWPPELLVKPIKAMCPEKVCRRCGEASRPIRENLGRERFKQAPSAEVFAVFMRHAMEGSGKTIEEVATHLGVTTEMIRHYRGQLPGPQLPSIEKWRQLAEILPFPQILRESMEIVDREYKTADRGNRNVKERLSGGALDGDLPKVVITGFSDCGHDNWRPGVVLDPFAGSGTTLAVATGHGREAIGIDLDSRNFDLALDRVGPLVLSRAEVAA